MGRKKNPPFNPKCAERLKELMDDKGLNQAALARETHLEPQLIYKVLKRIRITPSTAEEITKRYPEINIAWLLGYSDYKYAEDEELDWLQQEYIKTMYEEAGTIPENMIPLFQVLEYAGFKARWFNDCLHIMKDGHTATFSPELLTTFQRDIKTFIEFRVYKLTEEGW